MRAELRFNRELCNVVARSPSLQPILDWIVYRTAHLLRAEECCIKHRTDGELTLESTVAISRPASNDSTTRPWPEVLRQSVLGYLITHDTVLATPDIVSDHRFPGFHGMPIHVRALLAAPMRVDDRVTGLLAVSDTKPGRRWSKADIETISIAASHAASVLEMARLRVEAEEKLHIQQERKRIDKELALAREIQRHLVPEHPLTLGHWTLEGRVLPARQLGGDDYDYFPLGGDRAGLLIADVMGKSVPAALLVFALHGLLRTLADGRRAPAEVVSELNRSVVHLTGGSEFVTLFYGELDARAERLRYANAGHNPPLLRRADGALESLAATGIPIGIREAARYEEGVTDFGPDDALLLYSDGITEARDALQRMFGTERLEHAWGAATHLATGAFLDRLMAAVERFHGKDEQDDDMTALVVCRGAESAAYALADADDRIP